MELSLQEDRAALAKLRHSLLVGDAMRRKQCTSLTELQHEVEAGAVQMLEQGPGDACSTHAFLWCLTTCPPPSRAAQMVVPVAPLHRGS